MEQIGHDAGRRADSADYFAIAPHGHAAPHLDALCHFFYRGKMYNGFDQSEVGSLGAWQCAIDITRDGVSGRGILLNIPKIKRVEWLNPGEPFSRRTSRPPKEITALTLAKAICSLSAPDGPTAARPSGLGIRRGRDVRARRIMLQWLHDRKNRASRIRQHQRLRTERV